jgi:hypothetical protein
VSLPPLLRRAPLVALLALAVGCSRQQVDLTQSDDTGGTNGGGTTTKTGTTTKPGGTTTGTKTGSGGAGQGGGQSTGSGGSGAGGTTTTGAGGQGSGGSQPQGGALAIAPANTTVDLANGQPQAVGYTVTFQDQNGNPQDVTAQAKLWLDDDLGSFSGATLTADAPGATSVHAQYQGLSAKTGLTVTMGDVVVDPGAPGGAPNDFNGPKAGGGAQIVYPPDGLLVPPNMSVFELHFVPAAGDTLFELHLSSAKVDFKSYFGCTPVGGGCVYPITKAIWKKVSDQARGGDPVSWVIRGVNGQNPGAVSSSAPRTIAFGQEDVVGGVYYWNASPGITMRYEFGKSGQSAEKYLTAGQVGAGQCVGCHVVSRNGARIAVGLDIPGPAQYKVFDVGTKQLFYSQGSPFGGGGANFFSFTPDGKRLLASNGITTTFRNADNGSAIGADPLWKNASMPDFSPDGAHVVYVKAASPAPCFGGLCGATGSDKGSIVEVDFDGQNFTNEHVLVPYQGQNNYYPAFSPDGKWVLFNRSPSDKNSYDAPDAEVWVVPAAGGAAIKLATSFAGGDSWPKWTSSTQQYKGKTLLWLTFSSRRAYGLRLADKERAQIWMTAFDTSAAAAGQDPSYPAFWMPFQDISSANHIAQWVEKVVRKTCQHDADCSGTETCIGGICLPK